MKERTILVVTAHPDDEMGVGAVLNRYAAEGVRIFLICATSGERGTRSHFPVESPAELGRIREEELSQACALLGIEAPIFLRLPDGRLNEEMETLRNRLVEEFSRIRPQAVITFGPEGVTGHSDHRAVSCCVTEILQQEAVSDLSCRLYYQLISSDWAALSSEGLGRGFKSVSRRFITTAVEVSPRHQEQSAQALACHQSQFAPEIIRTLQLFFTHPGGQVVYFRRGLPPDRPELETNLLD